MKSRFKIDFQKLVDIILKVCKIVSILVSLLGLGR